MNKKTLAALAAAVTLLAACGSAFKGQYAAQNVEFDPSQGEGLAVLSTASSDTCPRNTAHLRIYEGGASYSNDRPLASLLINNPYIASHFADHYGNLHVLKLRPGRYYFAHYMPTGVPVKLPMYGFSVAPGEIVYLGEYALLDACTLKFRAQINDRMTRDTALLQQQNPKLGASQMAKRLAVASGYAVDTYQPPK